MTGLGLHGLKHSHHGTAFHTKHEPGLRDQNIFAVGVDSDNSIHAANAAARVNQVHHVDMAMDEPGMHRLLAPFAILNQQQNQQV